MDTNDNMEEPLDAMPSAHSKKIEERRAVFRQHIEEYETTADSFELGRALTYVTGDLLAITGTVGEVIVEHFQGDAATIERLNDVKEPMDNFIKLTRQIDRYENLRLRIEAVRSKSKPTDNSRRRGPHLGPSDRGIRPPGRY